MDFPDTPRPRLKGKHFKLFTDDLPKIDFNNSYIPEYSHESTLRRRHLEKRHREFNFDQLSLPPLGSPGFDRFSIPEPRRPQSEIDVFNPNIAQLQKKIQRRHTVREHRDRIILDQRFKKANDDSFVQSAFDPIYDIDSFVKTTSSSELKQKKDETINESTEATVEIEKPKSVFKQLLEASAKETARKKLVEDGFRFLTRDNKIGRRRTVVSDTDSRDKLALPSDNEYKDDEKKNRKFVINVPENKDPESGITFTDKPSVNNVDQSQSQNDQINIESQGDKTKHNKMKPGILKRSSMLRNTSLKLEPTFKPRLVHQDTIRGFTIQNKPIDDNKVPVNTETQLYRLSALVYTDEDTRKPKTKRRVNFDNMLGDDDTFSIEDKEEHNGKTESKISESADISTELKSTNNTVSESNAVQSRRKLPSLRKSKTFQVKPKPTVTEIKSPHISSFSRTGRANKDTSSSENSFQFEKLTENLKDPRADPFWKEAKDSLKEVNQDKDESENVLVEPSQTIDIPVCKAPVRSNNRRLRRSRVRTRSRIPAMTSLFNMFSDTISTPTNSSIFGNVDLESLPDLESFLDDIDTDAFPDEIDRSLIGEDLIKAYRLWDRKRKSFPGGLRKIEAPVDQGDDYMFSKPFGSLRTYKIPTQPPQEGRHQSNESKEPFESVFIGTF